MNLQDPFNSHLTDLLRSCSCFSGCPPPPPCWLFFPNHSQGFSGSLPLLHSEGHLDWKEWCPRAQAPHPIAGSAVLASLPRALQYFRRTRLCGHCRLDLCLCLTGLEFCGLRANSSCSGALSESTELCETELLSVPSVTHLLAFGHHHPSNPSGG